MKRDHFHRIQPICPVCRAARRPDAPLAIGHVVREHAGDIIEGVLVCSYRGCQREHPIIDGIPIIVADIRSYVTSQLDAIRDRADLSPFSDSLLGDCAGTGSELDTRRYRLSTYARSHYGDVDPDQPTPADGGVVALLDRSLAMLASPPAGVWVDTGCAVGRTAFEMAARTGDLVLGIDLSFAMLRLAREIAVTGRVRHPLRRLGMVYDQREFEVDFPARDRVALWACDGLALPLADHAFAGALSLNVLDCTASPVAHLMELGRVIQPGGEAIIATPYDWSANATAIEGWIGGHSQRSDNRGDSVLEMRRLLSDQVPPEIASGLTLAREDTHVPWHVYVHERATMLYQVHLIIARAGPRPSPSPGP